MLHFRHACAWTLLAVFAVGGTVAPDVHRLVHGLEREAILAVHARDGHHGPDGPGTHVRESCTTTPGADAPCALCQGTSASVVGEHASAEPATVRHETVAAGDETGQTRRLEAPSGRGPPERVA